MELTLFELLDLVVPPQIRMVQNKESALPHQGMALVPLCIADSARLR